MSFMTVPSVFEKFEGERLVWDIYSRLFKDRVIWLGTEVSAGMANLVVAQLLYLDTHDKHRDIKLYINSPGGSITAGMAIYDTMNYVAADVSTICVGQAASMGAFLLAAGAKGKRYILPNAEVLIHQPLGGTSGQASDMLIHAEHIIKLKKRLNLLLANHTGQPVKKINEDTDRDYIMTAAEALEYGIVDKVVDKRDKSLYDEDNE